MTIKKFIINNIIISFLDINNDDIKLILRNKDNLGNIEDTFINYNVASIILSSSNLKNNDDEITYDINNLSNIKNMIFHIKKDKEYLCYSSNITTGESSSSPYLKQVTNINSNIYSSTIEISNNNIEEIFNDFITKSIQNKSFLRIYDNGNNKVGILVELYGNSNNLLLYQKLFDMKKNKLYQYCYGIINSGFFDNNKVNVSTYKTKYKCICSRKRCIEIAKGLIKEEKNLFVGSILVLSCPICGKKYKIKESDL